MTTDAFLPYRSPRSASPQPADTHVEGQVYDVTPAGMRFTIKAWDGGKHVFGPAPWPTSRVEPAPEDYAGGTHDHTETVPTRGARCLVLFLGCGIDRPRILGWWPA